ncbi:UNVERIFIED_CONTAM: Retrovirus-related Pol polyprotein from transposon RE2 [Sesamum calycinum]|uniref:Retrovirus-related Pol polyprotein from transposon RE2 n=1 Tax=Sesamum calycinum TaxID=2727403 RepID=A0AAW2P8Z4_9LAMI
METEGANTTPTRSSYSSEVLQLLSSDHPGLILVSSPLDGKNFLLWSRAVRAALDLEQRYGQRNGPLLYQLEREIASVSQDLAEQRELMQFLMGLKDEYDTVRSQILVNEPLPSFNVAYSMVLRVEKQRQVHLAEPHEGTDFTFSGTKHLTEETWIIDSGATSHMCSNPNAFHNLHPSASISSIFLPDGSTKVTQSGLVNLFGKLKLTDTLYDHLIKEIVAVARHSKHLYILDNESFNSAYISQCISSSPVFAAQVQHIHASLWHMRLGHPSLKLDINNAFLHGLLDEELYMTLPDGYFAPPGQQSAHDHCLFIKPAPQGFVALLVYVDDILVMAPTEDLISEIKQYLDALFTIKDLGYAKYFLGLEIARSTEGMSIMQHKYDMDTITDSGMVSTTSVSTPLPLGLKLSATSGTFLKEPDKFQRLVGRLLYLGFTRLDLSFAVQQLSQFLRHPTDQHWTTALHIVRYLKGAPDTGIFFLASNSLHLSAYTDADWGACVDSRRSMTGYCVFLVSSLIS